MIYQTFSRFILLLIAASVILSCNDNLGVKPFKRLQIYNSTDHIVYFSMMSQEIGHTIDPDPDFDPTGSDLPYLGAKESLLIETADIPGYDTDQNIMLIVYGIESIAAEGHISSESVSFFYVRLIDKEQIQDDDGRITISYPEETYTPHKF